MGQGCSWVQEHELISSLAVSRRALAGRLGAWKPLHTQGRAAGSEVAAVLLLASRTELSAEPGGGLLAVAAALCSSVLLHDLLRAGSSSPGVWFPLRSWTHEPIRTGTPLAAFLLCQHPAWTCSQGLLCSAPCLWQEAAALPSILGIHPAHIPVPPVAWGGWGWCREWSQQQV